MGTGYAYWTDTINVFGTADTGDLEVKFVDADDEDQFSNYEFNDNLPIFRTSWGEAGATATNGNVIECFDKSDSVSIKLYEMYPGYGQTFSVKAKNFGTLAAKLGKITSAVTGQNKDLLDDAIGINIKAVIKDKLYYYVRCNGHWRFIDADSITDYVDLDENTNSFFKLKDDDHTKFYRLKDLTEMVADSDANDDILFLDAEIYDRGEKVEVDSTAEFLISVAMDPDQGGALTSGTSQGPRSVSDDRTENGLLTFTLSFIWDQYNVTFPEAE
jgi:hypothetical protein